MRQFFWFVPVLALLAAGCGEGDGDSDELMPLEITQGIALGEPASPADPAIEPAVAYDGTRVHIVYCQSDSTATHDVMYVQRVGAGPFSAPAPLYPASAGDSRRPSVALDASGTLHTVWVEGTLPGRDIWYVTRNALGVLSTPANVSNTGGQDENNPRVHVDVSGRVHIVWEGSTLPPNPTSAVFYTRTVGSVLAAPQLLPFANGGFSAEMPDVGTDENQHVYVVWAENMGSNRNIRMMRSDNNGLSFGNIGDGIIVAGTADKTEPRITCGVLGEVILTFIAQDAGGERGLFTALTRTGGTFSQAAMLFFSASGGVRNSSIASFAQADGARVVTVAFNDGPVAGGNILVRTSRDGGVNWPGDPVDLSQGNTQPASNRMPCVAMDDNEIVLSWVAQPTGGGVARTFTSANSFTLPE